SEGEVAPEILHLGARESRQGPRPAQVEEGVEEELRGIQRKDLLLRRGGDAGPHGHLEGEPAQRPGARVPVPVVAALDEDQPRGLAESRRLPRKDQGNEDQQSGRERFPLHGRSGPKGDRQAGNRRVSIGIPSLPTARPSGDEKGPALRRAPKALGSGPWPEATPPSRT